MSSKRKALTLEVKLDILKRFDRGQKAIDIAKALTLPLTTVKSIRNRDAPKIKESAKNTTQLLSQQCTRNRPSIMVKMESRLTIWIQEQNYRRMPLSKMLIKTKAKLIFDSLKLQEPNTSAAANDDLSFEASDGWFARFKSRANLHNLSLKGEAASSDSTAAEAFPEKLKTIIHDGGYCSKQIFNVDETGLFWKRLPTKTYISKMEKHAQGFKAGKERLTLLLGGNAAGDYKFKPFLIYASENPRALKGILKRNLPVHYRWNKKSWMTANLFRDWVSSCAIPELRSYCEKENLEFKILILLDNAPSHPVDLDELSENIKFVFLPPNTTALIQPMDQGVISNFKSYYLRRTFKELFTATEGIDNITMKLFWKNFSILNGIKFIALSWDEVTTKSMNGSWRKLWPECIQYELGNETSDETLNVIREVAGLADTMQIEGMEVEDIQELLNSHNEGMTNAELMEIDFQPAYSSNSDEEIQEIIPERTLTVKRLAQAIQLIDQALQIFDQDDPNQERSSKVGSAVLGSINCYKEIYESKKQQAVQTTIEKFFKK